MRTADDPRAAMAAVARALHAVAPTAAVENIRTLDQIRDDSLASRIFAMRLLVGFAVAGSLLTLVGIYGVLSITVASRRREIAIRAAVGGRPRRHPQAGLHRAVAIDRRRRRVRMAAAFVLSRALDSFLFEVDAADPMTLIAVGLPFGGVALLACLQPVRKAMQVDPAEALRCD